MEAILALEEEISNIQHLEIEPQIELMGEEIRTIKRNIDMEPVAYV
jgi:hypothetical protein